MKISLAEQGCFCFDISKYVRTDTKFCVVEAHFPQLRELLGLVGFCFEPFFV